MELTRYLSALGRRIWLIVAGVTIGAVAGLAAGNITQPMHTATTTLVMAQPPSGAAADYDEVLATERIAQTYVAMLRSQPVIAAALNDLQLAVTPLELERRVSASVIPDTQLISLSVRDTDAQRAADIANAIVVAFNRDYHQMQRLHLAESRENIELEIARIEGEIAELLRQLEQLGAPPLPTENPSAERRVTEALLTDRFTSYTTLHRRLEELRMAEAQIANRLDVVAPAHPVMGSGSSQLLLSTLLATLVGALAGVGLVVLAEFLDSTPRSRRDLETLVGAPVLAAVGRLHASGTTGTLVSAAQPRTADSEAYRALRLGLLADAAAPLRTLAVVSPCAGDGRSTTAANLAISCAQTGMRVVLVDADLCRPTLHQLFRTPAAPGLTAALSREQRAADSLLAETFVENLQLLPSGPAIRSSADMVGSQRLAAVIGALRDVSDIVIVDSPPAMVSADALLLAQSCDAVLLVGREGRTEAATLSALCVQLEQAGTRVAGAVLNGASRSDFGAGRLEERTFGGLFTGFLRRASQPSARPATRAADTSAVQLGDEARETTG